MQDLKLDTTTHDLVIGTDLTIVQELDYLQQKIKVVLWFLFAEWFLDVTLGIKVFEFVYIKNPNLTIIDSMYKVAISEINGVDELTEFDSNFESLARNYSIDFVVRANLEELHLTQEFTL